MKNKLMDSPYLSLAILLLISVAILTVVYQNERVLPLRQSTDFTPTIVDTLHVLSFPEYFPESVLEEFEEQYRIKVQVTPFLSPSQFLEMIGNDNRYDIVVLNDYLVKPLSEEGIIAPILQNKLSNYQYIDIRFKANDYDFMNQFSIPFVWGTVGLSYNTENIVGLPLSWKNLFDPEQVSYMSGRIVVLNDYRVTLGLLLMANGCDQNTLNEDEIAMASELLMRLIPYLAPNEILENLEVVEEMFINEELYMGMMWSGSATMLSISNHNLRYTLPDEGTIFWVDNIAFTSNSTKQDIAYKFVDYLLSQRVMASLSNTHYHANPVTYSKRYIQRRILNGPAYMNPYLAGEVTMIKDIGDHDLIYKKYWNVFLDSLKSYHSDVQPQPKQPVDVTL